MDRWSWNSLANGIVKVLAAPTGPLIALTVMATLTGANPWDLPGWMKAGGKILAAGFWALLIWRAGESITTRRRARQKNQVLRKWEALSGEQQDILRKMHGSGRRHTDGISTYTTELRWYEELVEWRYLDGRYPHGKYHGMPPTAGVGAKLTVEGWKAVDAAVGREKAWWRRLLRRLRKGLGCR